MASVASSAPDQRQLRLVAAAAQLNEDRVRDILTEEPLHTWTSHTDRDVLRQSLQKVCARGHLRLARLLLEHGADPNARRDNEIPALTKAAEGGHVQVVKELLAHRADPTWRNAKTEQTAVFTAAVKGHNEVVRVLLDGGAPVDAREKEGKKTAFLLLASSKPGKWNNETLKILVEKGADINAQDGTGRTALLWAATNGNVKLADVLLSGELGRTADLSAANNRGRTALHLAAESNQIDMVKLLLKSGADPRAMSDGGWTALHNAAQEGHVEVVSLLLATNANINAELSNGMTPLHWAAFNGHEEVVKLLLTRPDTQLSIKDSFYRTPMLCAAEKYNREIVQLLSPFQTAERLSRSAEGACKEFQATVVDFGEFRDGKKLLVDKPSVYKVLYGWDQENNKPAVPTQTKDIKYQPAFRWIHLPANNIAWVETLIAKYFVESGQREIEGCKALEKCFDQEHRGHFAHAHFMRTYTQRITARPQAPPKEDRTLSSLPEEPTTLTTASTLVNEGASTPRKVSDLGDGSKSDGKKKSKGEQIADRHPRRAKRTNGPPGNPPGTKESKAAAKKHLDLLIEASRLPPSNSRLVLFMPFLHFETDSRRVRMSREIKRATTGRELAEKPSRDSLLIDAYLRQNPPLHPRRTLDQFFYHGIDTSERDQDQVVYRYCTSHNLEPKVFMVDQLWLWVLGRDLVITCFPQRWDQPKQDPLNVVDGIIEEINAKTRAPIQSVYDLSMLITGRCSGLFDRHRMDDQNFQFLDMFESSIGKVTDKESQLFNRFNKASRTWATFLRNNSRPQGRARIGVRALSRSRSRSKSRPGSRSSSPSESNGKDPVFPEELLDIGKDTSLLAEVKDIRDELNIIRVILYNQTVVLDEFELNLIDELRDAANPSTTTGTNINSNNSTSSSHTHTDPTTMRKTIDAFISEVRKRARETRRRLEVHMKDVERMEGQAESIYTGLTHLLDLKQKHSNALEARFARDQAVIAAKQGQTVMVFTIVTIIFLPMSFIAAFFAINLEDWGDGRLTLAYVSKYMFGIGLGISIPLIAMAFTVTDIYGAAIGFVDTVVKFVAGLRKRKVWSRKGGKAKDEQGDADSWELDDQKQYPRGSVAEGTGYRGGTGYTAPYPRISYDPPPRERERPISGRLSPASGRAPWPRKASVGSGNAVSWARHSYESPRRRASDDLERGRLGGVSSRQV